MAAVLPFLPAHHPRHILHHYDYGQSIRNPIFKSSLHKTSAQTNLIPVQLTNACNPTNDSLLEGIIELCKSGDLSEALNLVQENPEKTELDPVQKGLALGILLQACGERKEITIGKKAHRLVWKSAYLRNDPVLNTRIITMYSMCGSLLDSRSVFDRLRGKNLHQWNALLRGYARNESYFDALCLFVELISETEYKPDNFTFPCVIKSCGGIFYGGFGGAVHGVTLKMGLDCDVYVGNALIAMYGKFGVLEDANRVFEYMPEGTWFRGIL